MTNSIADQVKTFLDHDFIIRNCLFKHILSFRALARYIIKTLELKESNIDAVISAIRRYKREEKKKDNRELKEVFSKIMVKTRSDIVDICIHKNKHNMEKISKINHIVDIEKGDVIRIIQAEEGIRIILDEKNLKKFYEVFTKHDCISIDKDLAELNINFTKDASKIKGILSLISSSLNAEDVSMFEVITCAPELLIFTKKQDVIKALQVLQNIEEMFSASVM